MPITTYPSSPNTISAKEFVEYVESEIDLTTAESLTEASAMFQSLSNNPTFLSEHITNSIKTFLSGGTLSAYTPQSIFLRAGKGFFLRANIWTPLKIESNFRSQEEKVFSYRNAHDHNFLFMTSGHFGPGYETDLYQYDPAKVRGIIGEKVDLEFTGRERLTRGWVMTYREKVDVHIQLPPESLSISLNLMVLNKAGIDKDQYFFDIERSEIIDLPAIATVHKRSSIIELAGELADENAVDVIEHLIKRSPCRRIREAGLKAAQKLGCISEQERQRLIALGATDPDELVRQRARELLA